jgi:hypothetical protein
VLLAIGARLENTSFRAVLSLGARRLRIRLRGLGFTSREPGQVSAEDLTRLDIYWSVATSLGIIDNVRATDFQARHLLLALRLGEPYRLARALAAEVVYSSIAGSRAAARTAHLLRAAEGVAARVDRPFARGWATLAAGMAAYWEGRFAEALVRTAQAEEVFRGCTGVWWETGSAQLFSLWALFYRGELRELCRKQPLCLQEADARGDAYTATNLRSSILSFVWLVADDPARAEAEVDEAMAHWSRRGYHAQHFWHMIAFANARLYRGDPTAAWQRLERDRDALRGALVLRVQVGRIEATDLRGRVALACAAAAPRERSRWLRLGRRAAGELEREGTPWARALAALLRAGLVALSAQGDRAGVPSVRRELARACAGFDALGMKLHAAVARACLAGLAPGDGEVTPALDPLAWFTAQGVRNPRRLVATLAPGVAGPP